MGRRSSFDKIALDLKQRVLRGEFPPGGLLPTERELSEHYEISRLTLRKALESLVEQNVVQRNPGRGVTVPAAAGRDGADEGASGTLIFIGDVDAHVYKDLFLHLSLEAQLLNQRLLTFRVTNKEQILAVAADPRFQDPATHIILGTAHDAEILRPILVPRSPGRVVRLSNMYAETLGCDYSVGCDLGRSVRDAVVLLAKRGHRRIAYAGPPVHPGNLTEEPTRRIDICYAAGYREGMQMCGLDYDGLIRDMTWGHQLWTEQFKQWLVSRSHDLPTAIICEFDFRATYLYPAIAAMGLRIPGDISVVGINDTPWCEVLNPALSSMAHPLVELAKLAIWATTQPKRTSVVEINLTSTLHDRASIATLPL